MPNAMSQAEPIKVGFLMDYLSESRSMDDVSNFSEPLDLVFRQGREAGLIDRDVEIVYGSAQGLPRATRRQWSTRSVRWSSRDASRCSVRTSVTTR